MSPARQVLRRDRERYGYRPLPPPGAPRRPTLSGWQKRGLVGALVVFLVLLLLGNLFGVSEVTVTGLNSKLQSQVSSTVVAAVHSRWNWGNLLTLNSGGLAEVVMAHEYELKSVRVQRVWPHGLKVVATPKQPAFIWATGGSKYLLDIDGSIIGPESGGQLPLITDGANIPVKPGDRVVPARFVAFCATVVTALPRLTKMTATGLRVSDSTSEVQVSLNRPFILKFDTTRAADDQLNDLVAVLAELTKEHKVPAEYIDLRIENRAYYR